jgi:glycosyltransferase involved in cell wall biosynthesis
MWRKTIAWHLYQRRDLAISACLHATAEAEAVELARLNLNVPIVMIPNGADIATASAPTIKPQKGKGPRTALFLGRIYPIKGLPELIEAWNRVRPEGWRLVIAGPDEGGHQKVVERAVAEAHLSEVVSFVGPLDDASKHKALSDAEFLVLPSHTESFGMVVAEALAHGVPVLITTGVPWPSVAQRGCGWCVEPTVTGLAQGLASATSGGEELHLEMGRKGREWVISDFGWPRVASEFIVAYKAAIAKRQCSTI